MEETSTDTTSQQESKKFMLSLEEVDTFNVALPQNLCG